MSEKERGRRAIKNKPRKGEKAIKHYAKKIKRGK
jgi:hypothetical protein